MNIVWLGQQGWHVTHTAKQHLVTRLVRRGHRVLYVDPITPGPPASSGVGGWLRDVWPPASGSGLRRVAEGLDVVTLPRPRLPRGVATRLPPRVVAGVAERVGCWAPVVVCSWPASRWLGDRLDAWARVYFAFDDNSAFGDVPAEFAAHQQHEERRALAESDLALAVSPTLVRRFQQEGGQPRTYLQENGVEIDDFGPAALASAAAHPVAGALPAGARVVGFVGQIDERMDQDLVARLARTRRDAAFVLAGPVKAGVDVSRMEAEPNVFFTGRVPYEGLAGVYKLFDVGIVPYVRSPLTEACNPLKAYEYLAADLPTVATDLPGLNSVSGAAAVCGTHNAFSAAVDAALADPDAGRPARVSAAAAASWQRRTDEFEGRLNEAWDVAAARRAAANIPHPRIDRPGPSAVRVGPRLDGKDQSVRIVSNGYASMRLTGQQQLVYAATRVLGRGYYVARRVSRLVRGDTRRVARILVVRNGHLGDTVVFFPTLRALREKFPHAKIFVALAPGSSGGSLLKESPYVDGLIELAFFNQGRTARWGGAMRLIGRGFDLVVTGVWYFNLPEAIFSGAPRRLGLYDGHPLQAYADHVVPIDPNLHEAELNLRLVEGVFGPVPAAARVPRLELDDHAVGRAGDAFRAHINVTPSDEVVAMHPGSKRPSRRWPGPKFARLATTLLTSRPHLKVVFTAAGADEGDLVRSIIAAVPEHLRGRCVNAYEAGGLIGLTGFYDGVRCLVCNDTGVMHVARSRGVPLVAVVGPENDRRWGPYPLGAAPAVVVRQEVPGTPHNQDVCDWNLSLASIDAGRVAGHVLRILRNVPFDTVDLDGDRFYPVVRDVQRLSFEALAACELRVPRVAVIVPETRGLLGLCDVAARQTFADALASARRQRYPALDVVAVTHRPRTAESGVIEVVSRGTAGDGGSADAAWAKVFAATQADLFAVWAMKNVPADRVAGLVSTYLRGPHAEAVRMSGPLATREAAALWVAGVDGNGGVPMWMLTRGLLRQLLDHPLPLAPSVPPETPPDFTKLVA